MASIIYLICLIPFLIVAALLGLIYFLSTEILSLKTIYLTLGRDLRSAYRYFKTRSFVKKCHLNNGTLIDNFRLTAEKHKYRTCFIFQDEKWTYKMVDELSNKVANYFASCGYKKGDEVALMLDNCPEYAIIWLGLAKIGVVIALINTNLKRDTLGHCVNCIDSKAIIFGRNFSETVKNTIPLFNKKNSMEFYCFTERGASTNKAISFPAKLLNVLLDEASLSPIRPEKYKINFHDKLAYIYTSGTTGLPKAAIFPHGKFIIFGAAGKYLALLGDSDVIYNPLPMYHTAGGIVFVSTIFMFGGSMIIKKKFSASSYWKDAAEHKATVGLYIGEMCRYLLNQPVGEEEKQHCVKCMIGNGLRSHIWKEFQERFRIKNINEFYGATEGNANLLNMFGKVGAVGFLPRICDRLCPVSLVKVDPESREISRNEKGFCIRCKPGEPGELIIKIIENPINSFDGYANQKDTEKKIIRNCFEKGDMAFLSGDILMMDEEGYLYFVDRAGDTFRWHGENVSSCEVENIISSALGHVSCVVYGVEVRNIEGRAGMAAIQVDQKYVEFYKLYQNASKRLPTYAIPLFLRLSKQMEETGTYKLKKAVYQKEGFNPGEINDKLFFLDAKQKTYIPLDKKLYSDIVAGNLRL